MKNFSIYNSVCSSFPVNIAGKAVLISRAINLSLLIFKIHAKIRLLEVSKYAFDVVLSIYTIEKKYSK